MERRAVVAWLGTVALGACGGGGGGPGSPAPAGGTGGTPSVQTTTPPPVTSSTVPSSDIAMWGDSLTPPVAANLQMLYPARTVFNGGVDGETSTQIAARQLAEAGRRSWINVFWYGQNNPEDPARIRADIAASVAALAPNSHFLVLSVVNEALPAQRRGGSLYLGLMQLNSDLANLYPQNYLDIRAFLIAHPDPTSAQDRQDVQDDVVPSSLRIDTIHLNNAGSLLVATKIKEFVDGKGW